MTRRMLIDRRRFLFGTGGAMLALPVLESLLPRTARGGVDAPPKRLVVVCHHQGRLVANGKPEDWWSPRTTTGPLPPAGSAPSAMLAALAPIRDEIVTLDGIDNLVRHASAMADGHIPALVSSLTCQPQAGEEWRSIGPSIDYVAGLRLRASAAMRPSLVLPASATPYNDYGYSPTQWQGPDGTEGATVSGNPAIAVGDIFGPPVADPTPTPQPPTLRERLAARRVDLLSGVSDQLASLRQRVSAKDRERLDRHAAFIASTQALLQGGGPSQPTTTCTRPDEAAMPHVVPADWDEWQQTGNLPEWSRGRSDDLTWPHQLENLVQALACDVVRVAGLGFHPDPAWSSEFGAGASPFEGDGALHNLVHGLQATANNPSGADEIATGFQSYGRKFTQLVQRLAEIEDIDGSRLLDNTLVVWVSEMGYGSDHFAWNIPVVMAGMPSAFPQGQGRHVVHDRRTMGDLWAHVLRMLGGDDQEFGATGTLGALADAHGVADLSLGAGYTGLGPSTPLHAGPLDL